MKLRHKKTGYIKNFALVASNGNVDDITLAKLNDEWEDYEEPKGIQNIWLEGDEIDIQFYDSKEAEKAVKKLEAWKRLKDRGFKIDLWDYDGVNYQEKIQTGRILFRVKDNEENDKDLGLLFGGEE